MLVELRVENLGLLRDVHLELGPGLNVITGETGAGKTLCVEALWYLCGARAAKEAIGPWGSAATIEARFVLPGRGKPEGNGCFDDAESGESAGEVIVRRVLDVSGRSRQYLNGHMATVGEIEEALAGAVQIYGQLSTRSLAEPRRQLELLDSFCGVELAEVLVGYSRAYKRAKDIERRLRELENPGSVAREIDFIEYQLAEIAAAALRSGEDDALQAELRRLEAAASLVAGAEEAVEALDSAEDAVWRASTAGPDKGCDPAFDALRQRCRSLAGELQEIRRDFRSYLEGVATDEVRLAEVRDRLDLIGSLKRKYGATIDEITAFAATGEKRLEELKGAEGLVADLSGELEVLASSLVELSARLSELRRAGARDLEVAVGQLLERLGMKGAAFEVAVDWRPPRWPDSCGPRGSDSVTFAFSASKGLAPRALQKVASGGELARLMLALEVAISADRGTETLVFDEIDQGVGGAAASAVGELLASVSAGRQVLCVTHLAQVASFADVHLAVEKSPDGAVLRRLREKERVSEISRMLGGEADSKTANRHAREILERAAERKAS